MLRKLCAVILGILRGDFYDMFLGNLFGHRRHPLIEHPG